MAKLKAAPKSYQEAAELLIGRTQIKLGNNTWLEAVQAFEQIAVRFHNTHIVTFRRDGRILLNSGGYRTVTTKERINQFIRGSLYQRKYNWYVIGTYRGRENCQAFSDGMDVSWCE